MSKKIKKVVFLIACCMLLFSGCNTKNIEKNDKNIMGKEKTKDPFEAYEDTITVTSSLKVSGSKTNKNGATPMENGYTKAALERLNIKLKWSWIASEDQYEEKLKVAVASGNLPDFIAIEDKEIYRELLQNGEIMPWNEALKYASEPFKEWLYRDPDVLDLFTNGDGEIMAIPQYWDPKRELNVMMIREDWLDELGLEVPKTIAELEEVAIAFKEKRGEGCGLWLTHEVLGKNVGSMSGLLNMFGSYPGAWIEQDGKLIPGEISSRTKNGLQILNDFYKKGIFEERFLLCSHEKMKQEVLNGNLGIVIAPFWEYDDLIGSEIAKNQDSKWGVAPIPVLEGTKGALVEEVCTEKYWVLSKECKHPEAVVKLFNLFVDFETNHSEKVNLENGFVWLWAAPQFFDPNDIDVMYEEFNKQISTGNFSNPPKVSAWLLSQWEEAEDYYKWKNEGGEYPPDNRWGKYLARVDEDGAWGVVRKAVEEGRYEVNRYYAIPNQDMSLRKKVLDQMTEDIFVKIVMGEMPIEEFDRYKAKWLELGGQEMIDEVNDWYKEKN